MIKKELDNLILPLSDEDRLLLAKEGFFVINTLRSGVFCPRGDLLYKKSTKKDGRVRYCSKSSCPSCPSPCFNRTGAKTFKEIDFSPLVSIKGDEELLLDVLGKKGLL